MAHYVAGKKIIITAAITNKCSSNMPHAVVRCSVSGREGERHNEMMLIEISHRSQTGASSSCQITVYDGYA